MNATEKHGRALAVLRSGGVCEVRVEGECFGTAHTVHHRKNRSQGGSWAATNLLHLCGDGTRGCHGWITAHPDTSCELGWSVRGYADPAQVLVLYRDGLRYRLTDTGHLDYCTHDDRLELTDPGYGNYTQCVDCDTQLNTDGGPL